MLTYTVFWFSFKVALASRIYKGSWPQTAAITFFFLPVTPQDWWRHPVQISCTSDCNLPLKTLSMRGSWLAVIRAENDTLCLSTCALAFMAFYWISCVLLGQITVTLTLLEHSCKSMLVLLPPCQYDRLQEMTSSFFLEEPVGTDPLWLQSNCSDSALFPSRCCKIMYLFENITHISALILMWILLNLREFLVHVFSRQGQQCVL